MALQMNAENGAALGDVGKINKEQFIKAALADQFRRKRIHIIGSGGNEDRRGAVLQPGEKRAQKT